MINSNIQENIRNINTKSKINLKYNDMKYIINNVKKTAKYITDNVILNNNIDNLFNIKTIGYTIIINIL